VTEHEVDLDNGWTVSQLVHIENGQQVVKALRIYAKGETPAGGVNTSLLREVVLRRPHGLSRWRSSECPKRGEFHAWVLEHFGDAAAARLDMARSINNKPYGNFPGGRPRHDPIYYADLAAQYQQLGELGCHAPCEALSEHYETTIVRMRAHIHTARISNFLTKTSQGKRGGVATVEAYNLLAANYYG
jgi:hypothetical protein